MASLVWALILFTGLACSPIHADTIGTQVSIEDYPYLVQVEFRVILAWLQQCAGSVLTSYHILSAASCFSGDNFSLATRRVRAGASYRGVGGYVQELEAVSVYPDYGTLGKEGDIAVVKLASAVPIGANVQQTPILGQGIGLPAGLQLDLTSWGSTTQGDGATNDYLYHLSLFTVDEERCLTMYFDRETITENMICAGLRDTNGRDVDSRDYGAPVFYSGVAVGVVSFGTARSDDSYPLVASAVGSYSNWIVETAV